ncbi:hypothetical protein MCEMSEM18_02425 [Comamonadaceae bacterium]
MICSSVNLFFTSNLLSYGIGLQHHLLLKYGGTSAQLKAQGVFYARLRKQSHRQAPHGRGAPGCSKGTYIAV